MLVVTATIDIAQYAGCELAAEPKADLFLVKTAQRLDEVTRVERDRTFMVDFGSSFGSIFAEL